MKRINLLPIFFTALLSVALYSCKDGEKAEEKEEVTAEVSSAEDMKANMSKSADVKYNPVHAHVHGCSYTRFY